VLEVEKETDKYYFLKRGRGTGRTRISKETEIDKIVDREMIFLLEDDFRFARSKFYDKHFETMEWYREQAKIQREIMEQIEKLEKAEE
jgi:transcription initiation factor IIE alpha subunit